MDNEVWVRCCLSPDHVMVSSLGRIKTLDRYATTTIYNGRPGSKKEVRSYFISGRILRQGSLPSGYKTCRIGQSRPYYVHRLVWFSFNGGDFFDRNAIVMHLNDAKYDNRISNLKVGTHSENSIAASNSGRMVSKFSLEQLQEIYSIRWTMTQKNCAKLFNCSQRIISIIWRGEHKKLNRFYEAFVRGEVAPIND